MTEAAIEALKSIFLDPDFPDHEQPEVNFVGEYGGLTKTLSRRLKGIAGEDEQEVIVQTFPVSNAVSLKDCEERDCWGMLTPDEDKKSVIFWTLQEPEDVPSTNIPRSIGRRTSQGAKLFVWLNLQKLECETCDHKSHLPFLQYLVARLHRQTVEVTINGMTYKFRLSYRGYTTNADDWNEWTFATEHPEVFFDPFRAFVMSFEFRYISNLACVIEPVC